MLEHTKRHVHKKFYNMRYLVMLIPEVCLLLLLKLKWPKNKSVYELSWLACLLAKERIHLCQNDCKTSDFCSYSQIKRFTCPCKNLFCHERLANINKVNLLENFYLQQANISPWYLLRVCF